MKRKHLCVLCDNEFAQIMAGIDLILVVILALSYYLPQAAALQ